jgi:hypothetical protein
METIHERMLDLGRCLCTSSRSWLLGVDRGKDGEIAEEHQSAGRGADEGLGQGGRGAEVHGG